MALAVAVVLLALALTAVAPLWLLLLSPLWLGVPHVAADLRHLVLRPPRPLPQGLLAGLALPLGAMTALRALTLAGIGAWPRAEIALGLAAIAAAALWVPHRPRTRAALGLGVLALGVPTLWAPGHTALLLGHVHNLVAVGLWTAWMGPGRARWVVPALVGLGVAALLGGALDGWLIATGALAPAAGLGLDGLVHTLAPGLPAPWDLRIVLCFAMLQAVHYGLWIACMPAIPALGGGATGSAWGRWWSDLGPALAVAVILGSVALPVAGLLAPTAARSGYLTLVLFHGWLELAIVAHLLALRHAAD